MAAVIAHAAIAAVLVAGYVVLTALGHDGNDLLFLLGGQGLGAGAQQLAEARGTAG